MSDGPGRAPYWWEDLLQVIPRFHRLRGFPSHPYTWVVTWLGGITSFSLPFGKRDDGDGST